MKDYLKNLIVTVAVAFCFLFALIVRADGYTDVNFNFDYSPISLTKYTASEYKYTTSPAYTYVKDLTPGRRALFSLVFGDKTDSSYTDYVYIDEANIWYCISSNTVEDRGSGCTVRLKGIKEGGPAMYVSGWWSADSRRCKKK